MTNAHQFTHPSIAGTPTSLGDYKGKVALVVNVASRCGLTPQYTALEELYREYRDRGLVVLGFPCNQFGAQEPGTESEIQEFCSSRYDVTFPMFSKLEVNGGTRHPLYAWLTEQPTKPEGPGDIGWNFAKFLIGKDGQVIARFSPKTSPTDPRVVEAIESALAA
jgi:glutathione peroxidase